MVARKFFDSTPRSKPKSTAILSRAAATRFSVVSLQVCSIVPPRCLTLRRCRRVFGSHAIGSRHESGKSQLIRKSRSKNSSRCNVPEEDRLPFLDRAATLGQENERAVAIVGVEPPVQDPFDISRSQAAVLAPMKFSRLRRSRFSRFEGPKSHAAKTAYVSSIIAPLMRVKDEATWERAGDSCVVLARIWDGE